MARKNQDARPTLKKQKQKNSSGDTGDCYPRGMKVMVIQETIIQGE